MNKLTSFFSEIGTSLKSKRVLSLIALFVVSGLGAIKDQLGPQWAEIISVAITLAGIYFGTPTGRKSV